MILSTKDGETRVAVEGRSLEQIALALGVLPDAHIFLRDGRPLPMTAVPGEGDTVRALPVASGG